MHCCDVTFAGGELATARHVHFFSRSNTDDLSESVRRLTKLQCALKLVAVVTRNMEAAPRQFLGELARCRKAVLLNKPKSATPDRTT